MHIKAFPWSPVRPKPGDHVTFEVELSVEGKQRAAHVEPVGVAYRRRQHRPNRSAPQDVVSYLALVAFLALFLVVSVRWALPPWVASR